MAATTAAVIMAAAIKLFPINSLGYYPFLGT
jgi:hypothetical protein